MKKSRRDRIVELIETNRIETQQELARLLKKDGFQVTQATISRDIRTLRLMKTAGAGGAQYYCLPPEPDAEVTTRTLDVLKETVRSTDTAGNLLVIRTASGMAMACASVIDRLQLTQIVGSIAGDDTIMAACRSGEEALEAQKRLRELLG